MTNTEKSSTPHLQILFSFTFIFKTDISYLQQLLTNSLFPSTYTLRSSISDKKMKAYFSFKNRVELSNAC